MGINEALWGAIVKGIGESLYMTLFSTLLAYLIGVPLGIALWNSNENGLKPNKVLHRSLDIVVNVIRSVPFLILLVAIMPFTRIVAGTTIGPSATVVPLVVASAPFVARLVESSLKEVDEGVIEAGLAMGCSHTQLIFKVLLPEARPSLLSGGAIAITTILGYSALAGFTGGGGLGAIAVNYGYYRYNYQVMIVTVILLVIIVQIFQEVGSRIVFKNDHRIKN